MRFLTRSLIGLFLLATTAGLLSFAGMTLYSAVEQRMSETSGAPEARERVYAANVLRLEPTSAAPTMRAFGQVRSRRTLELRAPLAGTIIKVDQTYEEGGRVQRGAVLLEIDPTDVQTALEKARTDYSEAEADLRDAKRTVELAKDELAAAISQTDLRTQALERQRNLLERGVGTETTLETAALAEAGARQSVVSRRQALAQAETRIELAETRLQRRAIELADAQRQREDTKVIAEFDGILADAGVVRGGLVSANEKIGELMDPNALEVAFRVSSAQYLRLLDEGGRLRPVQVEASLDVFGTELTASAKLTRESGSVGEGQTGRLLFAQLDEANGFRPGDFVTVRISEPEMQNVAVVPSTAVGPGGEILILGEDERLSVAIVDVLRRQGNDVIIRAAGHYGSEIISERSPVLGAGIKVRPVRPASETATEEQPQTVKLDDERRAKLVAFVESNARIPAQAKERILVQLKKDEVPLRVIERIEGRMGG